MTIKEIENLTEMSRANIRFYESEGLLSPARNVNGYRDYSEVDLAVLMKIKLLRSLHMPLDEVKSLHIGQQDLSVALEQRLKQFAEDKKELNMAQVVCEMIYRDGTDYNSLNAVKYLEDLKNVANSNTKNSHDKFAWETYWDSRAAYEDMLPKEQIPWRRFFARTLDATFYSVIWFCFLIVVFKVNIPNRGTSANFIDTIMLLVLTVVLEPIQLALFGTTLGKWILGICVWHNDDRKLSLSEAFERTYKVLFYGLGLQIPIYTIVRMWKSYKTCKNREDLKWEYNSRIILKDERSIRTWIYIGTHGVLFVTLLLAFAFAQRPVHRGELSVSQFCENYRALASYYGMENGYTLTNEGTWASNVQAGTAVIYVFGDSELPAFQFETDEMGMIQKISFTLESHVTVNTPESERAWMSSCQSQMQLASLAFVSAQDDFPWFSNTRSKMINIIADHMFEDYNFSESGVEVTCDVEYKGYTATGMDLLIPNKEGECFFYLKFSMEK